MLTRVRDKIYETAKGNITAAKYKLYYPIVDRIYYQKYLKEANEMFKKSQQMRQKREIKIPLYQNEKANKVFQDFCKSTIGDFGFENNKTSLCIIVGSNGIGKTTFIRQNLLKLSTQNKHRKIASDSEWFNITSFNCGSFGVINFDTFINNFENVLINSIHKQFSKVAEQPDLYLPQQILYNNNGEIQFDPVKIIMNVLYNSYSKEFLNLYARDMMSALINNEEITMVISDETKPLLSEIFNTKMLEDFTDFSEVFNDIVEVLKSNFKHDTIMTAIQLSVSLLARIEYENRPPVLKDTFQRDGIVVNTFLFDLLNYLEGYHPLNSTATQFAQNIVVFENFDHIFSGYQNDIRFYNFQDHILLRLYGDTRERDHFPVVIETSNSRFFNKELFEMLHIPQNTYGCIEIYGIQEEQVSVQYNQIFSNREINLLKKVIGANTNTWNKLLESITLKPKNYRQQNIKYNKQNIHEINARNQNENGINQNSHQNKEAVTFTDVVNLKTEFFEKEYIKFKSSIQSIYLDNTIADLLDGIDVQDRDYHSESKKFDQTQNENLIKFYVMDTLETLVSNYGALQITGEYAQYRLLENPVIKALLQANILYLRYYYSYLMFDKYLKEIKSNMSLSEKYQYLVWWRKNGLEKNSLIVYNQKSFESAKHPFNSKDFHNYKLNPELVHFKGIDFEVEDPSVLERVLERLKK